MNDRSLAQVDNENILLKTYGTLTYAYCKRRNIFIYIGAFDDAREAEIRAKKAYLNTHYTVDGQDAQEELEKKILPPRPPTNTHGVVLWTTKSLEHGSKDMTLLPLFSALKSIPVKALDVI